MSGRPGETARREAAAQASLAALTRRGDVECVNLAFLDDPHAAGLLPERHALNLDAPGVSGVSGARKPLITEMLDVLAAEAARRGIGRIGVVNGDILVTPAAIDRVVDIGGPAVAFSRTDVGEGAPEALMLYGVDMFVFDLSFWQRERGRFRPYLLGEAVWDNVYASLVVCRGGALLNRERLILHERHPSATRNSPFEPYVHLLAARDRSYFTLWCNYIARAEALRARDGSMAEEYALQRAVFHTPGLGDRAMDAGRAAWWRVKRMRGA